MRMDFEFQLWVNQVGTRKLNMHAKTCNTAVFLEFAL